MVTDIDHIENNLEMLGSLIHEKEKKINEFFVNLIFLTFCGITKKLLFCNRLLVLMLLNILFSYAFKTQTENWRELSLKSFPSLCSYNTWMNPFTNTLNTPSKVKQNCFKIFVLLRYYKKQIFFFVW